MASPPEEKSVSVASRQTTFRTENFLIETGRFKIRKRQSVDAVVFGIVGRLLQIVVLIKVFEIELNHPVLKCGERGASPVTESVTQKHKITDYTVGNHSFTE